MAVSFYQYTGTDSPVPILVEREWKDKFNPLELAQGRIQKN